MLASIFIARTVGADGLGVVNLSIQIISLVVVIGLLGFPQVLVKEIAIALENNDFIRTNNLMYSSTWFNGVFSLIISVILILVSPWIADQIFNEPRLTYPLIIGFTTVVPQVLSRIYHSGLIAFRKIWQSNLMDQTLSAIVIVSILFKLWFLKIEITINLIALVYAIGRVFVIISVKKYWLSIKKKIHTRPLYVTREMLKTSIPLFLVSLSILIVSNADLVMLGIMVDSNEIGIYAVASRIALLTSFVLQVTTSSLMPKVAAMYTSNQMKELEKMIQKVTWGLFIFGIIVYFIYVFFGSWILSFWGEEFKDAYLILLILAFGQLINLATGAVGSILVMTGYENTQAKISTLSSLIYIPLNFVLIYNYGVLGSAIATSSVIIVVKIISFFYVKKKIGFRIYY